MTAHALQRDQDNPQLLMRLAIVLHLLSRLFEGFADRLWIDEDSLAANRTRLRKLRVRPACPCAGCSRSRRGQSISCNLI